MDFDRHAALHRLGLAIRRHAPHDGLWQTALPRVTLIRARAPGIDLIQSLQTASVCLIAGGEKEVLLGDERYVYNPNCFMAFTTDLPVSGRVMTATDDAPYLCLRMDFDLDEVASLVVPAGVSAPSKAVAPDRGVFVSSVTDDMLDAGERLVRLLDRPADQMALAPMVMRELTWRVLRSDQGERLAQAARNDSQTHRVQRAVRWLRDHYTEPLRIETLAREAHMSPSSLHQHFRALTAMSPLQYQKHLRLQQARRLLQAEGLEVSRAGHAVGYESASQFSREYRRHFGTPPSRHREADIPAQASTSSAAERSA